jgi:hypothetical protein
LLDKENDVVFRKPEKRVLIEKRPGRVVSGAARHDEPRQRMPVTAGHPAQLLRLLFEERPIAYRANREGSLGAIEPEPRSLTTRHNQDTDLTFAQQYLAPVAGLREIGARATVLGKPTDGPGRERARRRVFEGFAGRANARESREIDPARARQQPIAAGSIECIEEAEDVTLAALIERGSQRIDIVGVHGRKR